jgi:hypothetical protein
VSIVLDPGENDSTWDLGLHLQNTLPGSLGDLVWFDEDQDGVQDAGEAGVAGVVVRLYDAAGNLVAETVTDANGNYLFQNLVAGVYFVQFVPPPNYTVTGQNLGGIGEDSDGDAVTGITVPTTLEAGENDLTWDLGIHLVPTALPEEVEPELTRFLYLPAVQMGVQAEGAGLSVETGWAEERAPVVFEAAPEAVPAVEPLSEGEEAVEMQEIETAAP